MTTQETNQLITKLMRMKMISRFDVIQRNKRLAELLVTVPEDYLKISEEPVQEPFWPDNWLEEQ